MDRRNGIKWITSSVLAVVLVTASAAVPIQSAARQTGGLRSPWEVSTFSNSFSDVSLSTTFFGPYQYPLIVSYNLPGYLNVKIKSGYGLNCGPGNEWACFSYDLRTYPAENGDVSPVATHIYGDTTSWGIASEYLNPVEDGYLHVQTFEVRSDNFSLIDSHSYFLIELNDVYAIDGSPALAFGLDGRPQVAFIRRQKSNSLTSLVYVHYDPAPTTPCIDGESYQCDVIDSSTLAGIGGPVGLTLTGTGEPRISYYKDTVLTDPALMYAYPRDNSLYHPNCGPGDTWRCVLISSSIDSDSEIDMAIGGGATRPQLAWTHHGDDTLNQLFIYHARYVGPVASANCGEDWYFSQMGVVSDYLWECHQVEYMAEDGADAVYQNVSIQVDSDDNPVIAFNTGETYFSLGVIYGNADGSYDYQQVDSPQGGINTGKNPQLALDKYGRGFIAFKDDDSPARLKIAMQDFRILLPVVIK